MKNTKFMNKRVGKAAILACLIVAFMALCMTGCQIGETVQKGEPVTLAADATQKQLQEKLADESVGEVILSGNIVLTEPLQITGSKTISGNGTISADGLKENYLIVLSKGSALTLGGDVAVDAGGTAGGVFVSADAVLTIQDQAMVKNASANAANVLVEGYLDLVGGILSGARGHNIYNKGETNVVGGEIRGSGSGFAGIYNEGTLSQNGGSVVGAYNNIVCAQGSAFTWNNGSNKSAVNNGVVIGESAKLAVTARNAELTAAGNLGIELKGNAVIDDINLNNCFNTMIKVASTGNLTLNGGMIFNGSYHGVDNDGVMVMNGGDIMTCADCGIVNTGTLEVKGGGISDNGNKGILNKLEGKAVVVSADVIISGNRFAIGNDDKAYFELAKAALMMSTTSNIYALDGEMYIHDIELAASSSNNIRVVAADLTLNNVTVNGNASNGSQSMHGIILEGGTVTAKDLVVRNTTGAGIRNKGGVFTGTNVTLTNNAYIGLYTSDQDVTGRPGTTTIENLTVSNQGYMSISNNGTGVTEITNAVFEATPSNNIRVNGGTLKLNKVEVKGHTNQATTAHHGIYLEGGKIIANDVTITNTKGHGLRNKSGDFTGTNITIKNVNGDAAVSNALLGDGTSGTITLTNVSFSNVKSKNIVSEAGTTIINGSYLSAAPGSNIKITGGSVALNGVTVAGNQKVGKDALHAIILENGNGALYMNDVTICDAKDSGIRNKSGVVKGTDVTIKDCGVSAISNGQDTKRGLKGITTIDGLTVENCGNNNIIADAGEVHISNATLAPSESNNVKTSGSALITLSNTVVNGSTKSYGVIAEGGTIELTDVTIRDTKTAGIRVNKAGAIVTGKNVTIENTGTHGLFVDKGTVIIHDLTTKNIGQRNIQVGANENKAEGIPANGGKVTIIGGDLCKTENQHSVVAYGEKQGTMVELTNVVLHGSGKGGGSRHVLLVEGGNMKLTGVTIKDANNAALRVNKAASTVEAEDLIIEGGNYGISASAGTVTVKGLKSTAANRNIAAEGATITVVSGTLGNTSTHNIKINKGTLNLEGVTIEGSSARGIMIEPGASDGQPTVNLENVTISNTNSQALENRGGIVTAKDLTINGTKANAVQNQIHKDGKTSGTITVSNLNTSGVALNNILNTCAGTVTVNGGTLGVTAAKTGETTPHSVKATKGHVELTNVILNGVGDSSAHVLMAEGGDMTLTNLTVKGAKNAALRVNNADSEVKATNLVIQDSVNGLDVSDGKVTVNGLTSYASSRNVNVSVATVTITDATLGKTNGHNVKAVSGSVILTNAIICGTTSNNGIMAEGGDFVLTNVTIKDTTGRAIWMNNSASEVVVTELTVENCASGVGASAGTMTIDTLTAQTTGYAVEAAGGNITIKNANVTNSGTNHVVEHTGGTLNLENVEVGAAGEGFFQIHNTAENLNISGKIVGDIFNDAAVAVNVTAALSEDTAIVIDWAEGNAPTGTAISFAEGTVEAGQKCFTLGPIQSQTKELVYTGNTGVLENLADYVAMVGDKKYESLEEALAEMNKLTGDVTLTILADCATAEPIVVPTGMNLTIQGDETVVGLNATVKVSEGATLTIGENVNISNVDATAGGTILYAGNTATAESPLNVTVKGEPHEVAVTLPEGSTATVDLFRLVDAQGTVYGSMLENGKIKVYTKDVNSQEAMQAAIDAAPVNAKGYIRLVGDVTLNSAVNFTANKVLTVLDDGNARTIRRGETTGSLLEIKNGANITIKSSGSTELLIIDGSSADGKKGTTLVGQNGTLTLQNVALQNNTWDGNNRGLGIYASSGSTTYINDTRISNIHNVCSTKQVKAAAMIVNGATVYMNGSTVENCSTSGSGVVEITTGGKLYAVNSTFSGNKAVYGGAIIMGNETGNILSLDGCSFDKNTATTNAGAIQIDYTKTADAITFKNTTFTNNTAANEGGAISAASGATITMESCQFSGNKANRAATNVAKSYGNDVRLGNAKNVVNISGKMQVEIFNHNAATLYVVGNLTAGSNVRIDGRTDNYKPNPAISFASEEVMAASQDYIRLGETMTAANKVLKFADAKAVLVDATVVTTPAELTNALAASGDFVAVKLVPGTEFAVDTLAVNAKEVIIQGQGSVIKYSGSVKNTSLLNLAEGTTLTVENATLDCNNVGKIIVASGETLVLDGCTVKNAKGCSDRSIDVNAGTLRIKGSLNLNDMNWALCVRGGGKITSDPGSKVTINSATYGVVLHDVSSMHLNSLVASGVANNPVYVDNAKGVMVIDKAEITGGKNAVHLLNGSLTLNNANISGATTYGIYLKNTTSQLYGTNIHIEATGNSPINADNGIVDISNFSTADLKGSHSIKATGTSNVTVSGLNLGVSNSNAIRLDKNATLTLKGTCVINGTKGNHGIAFGAGQTVNISGDFTTANIAGNGIHSWGGTLNISGKINTNICFETTGNRTLNITGALTNGSNLVVDWTATSTPDGIAIQFASAADLTASKGFITLGSVQAENYELSYGETTATLIAKAASSSAELVEEATQEQ